MNDLNQYKQTLIVFDDMVTDIKKAPIIQEWFIRGRKRGASIMYLSQSKNNKTKYFVLYYTKIRW